MEKTVDPTVVNIPMYMEITMILPSAGGNVCQYEKKTVIESLQKRIEISTGQVVKMAALNAKSVQHRARR